MAAKWIEFLTGSLDEKKAYRQYKARVAALPNIRLAPWEARVFRREKQ